MRIDQMRLMLSGILALFLLTVSSPAAAQDTDTPPSTASMNGMCKMMGVAADSGATSMGQSIGMNGQMRGMGRAGINTMNPDSTAGGMQGCMMMQTGMQDSTGSMNPQMRGMQGMGQGGGQGMKGMNQGGGQGMKGMNQGGGQGAMGMGMGMMMMTPDSTELSPEVINAIGVALQDEYRSESLYQRVLDDHGSVLPFANIVKAERMHASHLVDLLEAHGATVPESSWTPANSPSFATVKEACTASIQAEIDNIAVYDGLYGIDLPKDVLTTFQHLQMISQEMHLPAFKSCASG